MPESRILHIHSGDSSADAARASGIAGEHIAFREAVVDGPADPALRGEHVRREWGIEPAEYDAEMTRFRSAISNGHDEVVLWFDEDLFCRVNFWFVVTQVDRSGPLWLSRSHNPPPPPELLKDRQRLSNERISAAVEAWNAYSSDDPRTVESLIAAGSPFARPLGVHLTRFPSVRNGLGVLENRILERVGSGERVAQKAIAGVMDDSPEFSFGDAQVWSAMKRVAQGDRPLLRLTGSNVEITSSGEDVLAGHADAVKLNGIDLWLGGVHLRGREIRWRWDGEKLVSFRA